MARPVGKPPRAAGTDQVIGARDSARTGDVAGAGRARIACDDRVGQVRSTGTGTVQAAADQPGRVSADCAVGEGRCAGIVKAAAVVVGRVCAQGAVGQGQVRRDPVDQAAAAGFGRVSADGAVGQGRRAAIVQAAAGLAGRVPADGAVGDGQVPRAGIVQATAGLAGRAAADGAAVQARRAFTVEAAAARVCAGFAVGDRQARERRRDTAVDLEDPAQTSAADADSRRRARDRLHPLRVAQLERVSTQRDRLRGAKVRRSEFDGAGTR